MKMPAERPCRAKNSISSHEIGMKILAERPCGAKSHEIGIKILAKRPCGAKKPIKYHEIGMKMPAERRCGAQDLQGFRKTRSRIKILIRIRETLTTNCAKYVPKKPAAGADFSCPFLVPFSRYENMFF